MNNTKHFHHLYRSGLLLIMLIVGGLLLPGIGTSALADTPTVNGTINAGPLSETAPGPYSFTGTPSSTATFTMPFSVDDLTGGAAGWNITITSTQFTTGTYTIPMTASTIIGTSGVCAGGMNCAQASLTNTVSGPVAIPAGATPPIPVKFFGIAAVAATGVYTITPTITCYHSCCHICRNVFECCYASGRVRAINHAFPEDDFLVFRESIRIKNRFSSFLMNYF